MPAPCERDLTVDEFERFRALIRTRVGIDYPTEKRSLLSNRVRRRLRDAHVDSYEAYLHHVVQRGSRRELQLLIDAVTTNESWFFRCERHWDLLRTWSREQAALPAARAAGLRLWSAAAAHGAEACTALIVLEQALGRDFGGLPVSLLATDVSVAALDEARTGVYGPYALAQTPRDVVARWFRDLGGDRFAFDPRLHRLVTFERHNLLDPLPGVWDTGEPGARPPCPGLRGRTFDLVLLRNVLMYFDRASKERVLANVHRTLRPGGLLLIGEAESLLDVAHGFRQLQPSCFEKPVGRPSPSRS